MSSITNSTSNGSSWFDALSQGVTGIILSTIITVIITVILTFLIQNYLNRPKIRGKIFNVIRATWTDTSSGISRASFWVYVYLTNYHRNSISLLDYEFEADFGQGYVKLDRVYGDISKGMPETLAVKTPMGTDILLRNLGQHLLYKNAEPIGFGRIKHGFIMFSGDLSLDRVKEKRVKFTCIDVFNKKHVMTVKFEEYININLLLELLDVVAK